MDMKEKLVELLKRTEYQFTTTHSLTIENVADDLIAHGVTVQEWVSVEDRLPEKEDANPDGSILAINKIYAFTESWGWDIVARFPKDFTCWMQMPKPQKRE